MLGDGFLLSRPEPKVAMGAGGQLVGHRVVGEALQDQKRLTRSKKKVRKLGNWVSLFLSLSLSLS